MRVGEFYEAFGADAVLVVEYAQTSPHKNELRTSVRQERIQAAASALVRAGFRAVVYEESAVIVSPRERVFAQVVADTDLVYRHATAVADCDRVPAARPIVGVEACSDGTWNVTVVRVDARASIRRSRASVRRWRRRLPRRPRRRSSACVACRR